MKQIGVAIVGTGWCGGIRAETCAAHPLVRSLHLAEVRADRLEEISGKTNPKSRTANYQDLVNHPDIEAVYISATPEDTHFPMARYFLAAARSRTPPIRARAPATGGSGIV